jgi:uncharacterized protein YndB with AHSA1/START domain
LIIIGTLLGANVLLGSNFIGKTQADLERSVELQEKNALMEGKQKTDHSITLNYVVEGSPAQIFNLWTTVSEIKRFFGTDAFVDLRPGGSYEIYFLPRQDPNSDVNSTKGARLLDIKKDEKLAFEWTMPPFASELNTFPLPTWVEVTFQALNNNPNKTHVCLKHYGFKRGGKWDKAYEYFVRNWALILFRLDLLCATDFSGRKLKT